MNTINGNNVSNICRICLEISPKLYPLEGQIANVDVYISEMITYSTSVEVVIDEDLPKGVCIPCFKIVRIAYNFIKEFRESNDKLLAERESNKYQFEIKEERHEEIQVDESVINNHSENDSWSCSQEENITIKYIPNDSQSCNNEFTLAAEALLENGEEISENRKGILETTDNLSSHRQFDNSSITRSSYKFDCPVCLEAVFAEFSKGLARHLYRCHRNSLFKCNKCSLDAELTVSLFIGHYANVHLYRCPTCNKKHRTKNSFFNHMKSHTESQCYRCPHQNCAKSFRSKLGLKKHLPVHSNIANYICSACGKKFITYDTFRYHIKTHDGKRSYLCNVCGKAFFQSVHLKYHMWQHTGMKQFRCADCDRSYTSVTQLKKHRRKYCGSGVISQKLKPK